MEVYTLELSLPYSDDDDAWSRIIEVREDFDLESLHNYIQELVEFDDDHLYEFYVGKTPRRKSYMVPDEAKLNDIYPITGQKLYYLFDYGDSWLFQIKKSRKKLNVDKKVKYPRLVAAAGVNPEQYPDYE